jgi:mRNA interferase MazF
MPNAKRGEVWQVDLGIAAKVRPAVVLSIPFLDQERALYAIVPHTTALRGTRFEVSLQVSGLAQGAFDVQGLRSIPPNVLIRKLGTLTPEQLTVIDKVVKQWLALT